jgi:hypothetical protein
VGWKYLADKMYRFTRTVGSITGLYCNYAWAWYFWREAHEYVMTPLAIFLCGTALLCDLIYPFVLASVKNTELLLPDGRKIGSESRDSPKVKRKS